MKGLICSKMGLPFRGGAIRPNRRMLNWIWGMTVNLNMRKLKSSLGKFSARILSLLTSRGASLILRMRGMPVLTLREML